jgi:hypothetical protein
MTEFTDIKIVDLDVARTRSSDKAPGLRHMFLKLSAPPPGKWAEILVQERTFPRHTMWRDAWIEDDYLIVDCVPEELESHHLRDLKQDVAPSNAKYRGYLRRLAQQHVQQQQAQDAEREHLSKFRERLRFD